MRRILLSFLILLFIATLLSCANESKDKVEIGKSEAPQELVDLSSAKADGFYAEEVVHGYEGLIIQAINENNFSYVENLLAPGSNLYISQKKLVQDLYKKGIKEKLIEYSIESIEETSETGTYKVYVKEKIEIDYPEKGKVTKDFSWIYTSVEKDKSAKLTDLEAWNE